MGAHGLRRLSGAHYYLVLAGGVLLALAALGGASRADELQQSFVILVAIAAIAAALWPLDFAAFRGSRVLLVGLGLTYLLLIVQLIPLPADLWARMPGHRMYTSVAEETQSLTWRPWTLSPDLTLDAIAGLLPATGMGLLALALDFRSRLVLARLVVGIACFSALLGMLQFAGGGSELHLFRTSSENSALGLFANRNHQAVLMACALPMLAALTSIRMRQQDSSPRQVALAASIGTVLLIGLTATGSRMGLLLGLVGLVAGFAIYLLTGPRLRKTSSTVALVGGGLAVAAVPVSLLLWRSEAVQRLTADPVDHTRMAALGPMLNAARAFFPFGAGFGTFEPVYPRFEPDALLSTIYLNQAHNEPMQLAIEGGAAALLLLSLFLLWWVRAVFVAVRPSGSSSRRALAIAMAATTLILMLSSLVDYPLRTPLLSSVFAIACVELVRAKRRIEASPRL